MAILLIYGVFCSALAVILMNLIPMVAGGIQELGERAPELTLKAKGLVDHFNNTSLSAGQLPSPASIGLL